MFNAQPRLKTASGVENRIIWFESCRPEGSNVEFLFRDVKTDQKTHRATAAAAENWFYFVEKALTGGSWLWNQKKILIVLKTES